MIKERKSNFELLKIIAMLMIISFHYVYKSGYVFENMNLNSFIIKSFWFLGELGVNLFMLITGYFMINKKMSLKKVMLISIEVFFYNLLNVLLNCYLLKIPLKITDIIFPVILDKYWFVSVYIIIYILSPYFNKLIINMSKKEFEKLLIIVVSIWSIIPTVFGLRNNSSETILYYSRFIWMVVMYFMGAFIKLYDIKELNTKKKSIFVTLITWGIMTCSILFIYYNKENFNIIGTYEWAYLWTPNNFFMLILSVSVFQYFSKLRIKDSLIINTLASTTLGIYMLHDGCFNTILWRYLLNTKMKLESKYSIFYIIVTSLLIFAVGAVIDLIRKKIEKYTISKLIGYYSKKYKQSDNIRTLDNSNKTSTIKMTKSTNGEI